MLPKRTFLETCRRKVRYSNIRAAFSQLITLACGQMQEDTLVTYRCKICDGIHVGHGLIGRRYRGGCSLEDLRQWFGKLGVKPYIG